MKKRKKALFGLLALALTFAVSFPAAAGDTGFADVPGDAWYAPSVAYCNERGWMSGTSDAAFSPFLPMNRAMLATALYRAEGAPPVLWTDTFLDVEQGAWFSDSVIWAAQASLVSGYGEGLFGPRDTITREQMVTILWRHAGSPAPDGEPEAFADADSISPWAADAVAWARARQVVGGRPGNLFAPKSATTRAETAAILMNYFSLEPQPPDVTPEPEPEPDPLPQPEPDPLPQPEPLPEPEPEDPLYPNVPANPYDPGSFAVQDGFLHYTGGGPSHVGIDVSSYQGEIDWQRVAASGVEFALIRAGYRGYVTGVICQDDYFRQNIEGALAAGLDVGAYFFSQAVTPEEAVEEARQLMSWVQGYPITYPLVFDWERVRRSTSRTNTVDGAAVTTCALAFCRVVADAGYIPMNYANTSNVFSEIDLRLLNDYPFWLAHYTSDWAPTGFEYKYHMWQYSSKGRVDGIDGNVDLDLCLVDWPNW